MKKPSNMMIGIFIFFEYLIIFLVGLFDIILIVLKHGVDQRREGFRKTI